MFKILFKHKLGEVAINTFFKNIQKTFKQQSIDPSKIKAGDHFYKVSSMFRYQNGDTNACEVYDVKVMSILNHAQIDVVVQGGKLIQTRGTNTETRDIKSEFNMCIYTPGIYELIPMDASE